MSIKGRNTFTWPLMLFLPLFVVIPAKSKETKLYYMNENCQSKIMLHREAIRLDLYRGGYPYAGFGCNTSVEATLVSVNRLVTTFRRMDTVSSVIGICSDASSRLDIYDGPYYHTGLPLTGIYGLCGKNVPKRSYHTFTNYMTFGFKTGSSSHQSFEAVITPYHEGQCFKDEYKCSNGYCVASYLRCDGYNNCGDNSDEKNCKFLLTIGAIIGIVVGCIAFIAIIIGFVVCCCCCPWCCSCEYQSI
ncbi:hypothetical protein CHS0354_033880 [Potamilus streckersoni]|uniref:CUB domain-containing protein n=1 Tax=Potamilus streckersoni TaxID=2493646 RepID=A0AAE0RWT2_9BIVA|nr:hypothetical protein CHS0354_033880 [Potamilus streckersoni]